MEGAPPAKRAKTTGTDHRGVILIRGDVVVCSPTRVLRPGYVVIDDATGAILGVTGDQIASDTVTQRYEAPLVVPGFVDIHNHGVGGPADDVDVTQYWNFPAYTTERICRYGTASLLATLVFPGGALPPLGALRDAIGREGHGAVVRGVHCEGPIVATLGGLPPSEVAIDAGFDGFVRFLDELEAGLRRGDATEQQRQHLVKIMTISPSVDVTGGYARIKELLRRGVRVSLGHDKKCTAEDILGALSLQHGASASGGGDNEARRMHLTHCFNVQTFHHRDAGLANFALVPRLPNLPAFSPRQQPAAAAAAAAAGGGGGERRPIAAPTVELIGDGAHVSPLAIQAVLAARDPHDVAFITDAVAEPVPGKEVHYHGHDGGCRVAADGRTVVWSAPPVAGGAAAAAGARRPVLCGSCANLHDAFVSLLTAFAVPLPDAVAMVTSTPARIAGIDSDVGTIESGKRGDLVLMAGAEGGFAVLRTLVGGKSVFAAD